MTLYAVISRDNGLIGIYANEVKAQERVVQQIESEELSGGRPSVYYEKTNLIK